MLDYGCGRGYDADHYGMFKYDPYWVTDELPNGKFDTITCNYVLNVIPTEDKRLEVLERIRRLLKDDGRAYITVRRDIKEDTATQFVVKLGTLEVLKETSTYCTYILKPYSSIDHITAES